MQSRSPAQNDREPPPLEDLVLRGRGGDREALKMLIELYQGRVAGFVVTQTRDASNYEDICQAIFVKMVIALPRLRSTERFESWLFQIARNACRDHLRARQSWLRIFVAYEQAHDSAAAAEPQQGGRNEMDIERGMERLTAEQRSLLELSLEKKRSYEELARLANASVSAVKSRLHRARENLRALMVAGDPE